MIWVIVVVVVIPERNQSTTDIKTIPAGTTHLGPNLSNILPIIGCVIVFTIPPGNKTSPAEKAFRPRPLIKYMDYISMAAIITISAIINITVPTVNMGCLNALKYRKYQNADNQRNHDLVRSNYS